MIEQKPEYIISRLRQTINSGKYGKDYTISRRDKNNKLRELYIIDDSKIKSILLSLNQSDYIGSEMSDNADYPNDIVHKFVKSVSLIPRLSEKIELVAVELYIKFTWSSDADDNYLLIISFHESEE